MSNVTMFVPNANMQIAYYKHSFNSRRVKLCDWILGRSLFTEIPLNRTCGKVGIPATFCICHNLKTLPVDDGNVLKAASIAVKHLNKLIKLHKAICENWTLKSVLGAQVSPRQMDQKKPFVNYMVSFTVNPAEARFDATIRKYEHSNHYMVKGKLHRTSIYGKTSSCMTNRQLLEYCYCKKNIRKRCNTR